MFITRAYNSFEIRKESGTLIKRSKEERLRNEIDHYESLPDHVKIWFPRVLESGFDHETEEHTLELEFYA